jgi:arylsulfatase A-like enzyme
MHGSHSYTRVVPGTPSLHVMPYSMLSRPEQTAWIAQVKPVDPSEVDEWGEAIRDAYRLADAILGELRHALPSGAKLLVISDHGFKALLPGQGNKAYFAPLTKRLQERLSAQVGPVQVSKVGYKLAVMLTEDDRPLKDLAAAVEGLLEQNGQPFYRWEELPDTGRGLGLTLVDEDVTAERIAAGTVLGEPMKDYVRMDDTHSGDHDSAGIFMAVGTGIPVGLPQDELGLLDIAPTVLGLLGLPKAQDMAGKAVYGGPSGGPASYSGLLEELDWGEWAGQNSDQVNEERLRELGYVE